MMATINMSGHRLYARAEEPWGSLFTTFWSATSACLGHVDLASTKVRPGARPPHQPGFPGAGVGIRPGAGTAGRS